MTGDADLIALCVTEVRAIVVGVVLRPQTRCTLRCAAVGDGDTVSLVNRGASRREECNHLTIADGVGLSAVRCADDEQRPGFRMRLPTGPRPFTLTETLLNAEYRHKRSVESKSALEVVDADEDVREHAMRLHCCAPTPLTERAPPAPRWQYARTPGRSPNRADAPQGSADATCGVAVRRCRRHRHADLSWAHLPRIRRRARCRLASPRSSPA